MSAQIIDRRYVVGMTWQQTVQAVDLRRHAQQLARKARAGYYCTVGATTIGTAKLRASSRGEKLIALAAGVATLGQAHAFVAIRLKDRTIWICGSLDHAPATGFDQVVTDQGAVQALFQRFQQQAAGEITIYASEAGLIQTSKTIEDISLPRIVQAAADSEALAKAGSSIPLPYLYLAGAAIVALGCTRGWDYWQAEQRRKAEELERANAIDPRAAWTEAYKAYARQRFVHGDKSLKAIRDSIDALPPSIDGWRLKKYACVPAGTPWTCEIDYERTTDVGLDPTNEQFERLRPRSWTKVQFKDPNLVTAVVVVPTSAEALDFDAIPPIAVQERAGISALQKRLRAFAGYKQEAFQKQTVTAPISSTGEAIPLPAELDLALYKSPLNGLTGPLRSVDLLVTAEVPVIWTSITVVFDRLPVDWLEKGEATLTKSVVTATLNGEIYAKQ